MSSGDRGTAVERVLAAVGRRSDQAWLSRRRYFSGWYGSCRMPSTFAVASDSSRPGTSGWQPTRG